MAPGPVTLTTELPGAGDADEEVAVVAAETGDARRAVLGGEGRSPVSLQLWAAMLQRAVDEIHKQPSF